jgi:hypothetical protein
MIVRKTIRYAARLSLLLFIGIVMTGVLPVPAQADGPVDLVLSGEGSTSWSINNVKPGDSGTKTVELYNASSSDGFVLIWISDILSSEGVNYESETDTAEPGELINYLLLNVSCSQLDTSLSLPATVEDLPQSATDTNSIMISPIYANEAATLVWEWQFTDTGGDQNDAQGDSLSFSINYLLQELTTSDGSDDNAVNSNVNYYTPLILQELEVDMFGEITLDWVSESGMLINPLTPADSAGRFRFEINRGTAIFSHDREIITKIEVVECRRPRLPPDGMMIIGFAYDIIGYVGDSMVRSVTFNQPVKLTLGYEPDWLPANASPELSIAWYDAENDWVVCNLANSTGEPGEISAYIKHASTFAILGRMKPAEPEVNITPIPNPDSGEITTTGQDVPDNDSGEITTAVQDIPDNQPVPSVPPDETISEELHWQAVPPAPAIEDSEFLLLASLAVAVVGIMALIVLISMRRRRRAYLRSRARSAGFLRSYIISRRANDDLTGRFRRFP